MSATDFIPAPRTQTERRQLWLFMLVALLVIGAGIGLRDPWPADEPRFALAAKQMVESGNWLIPHRGTELYSDKPPMFMAMQAAAYTLTGSWRIAFLLPSLLAALGTLFLIYDFGRRLWTHRVGLWAAIAVLATFQFVYQAKRAQIDPLVTFFITLANYGLLRHFLLGPNWRAYWLGCFAAGLGVISKGVGILALFMFLPYLLARWRRWEHLPRFEGGALRWLGGALAFLIAVGLWIAPLLIALATSDSPELQAYAHDILFRQTAGRYANSWAHEHPPWYFIEVVAYAWLPLTIAMVGAFPRWLERLRARDARILLPLGWVVIVFVFFSIPTGKRDMYILPALPWVALLVAPYLDDLRQRPWFRWTLFVFVVLLAILFIALGSYAWSGSMQRANELVIERGIDNNGVMLWAFIVAVGALAACSALIFRIRRSVTGLGVTLAGMWLLWGFWAYPILNDSNSAAKLMRQAGELAGPDAQIALVGWKEQNLLLADRAVTDFGFRKPRHRQLAEAIQWQEAEPARRRVFILDEAMQPCVDPALSIFVGNANRRSWYLFGPEAVAADCRGGSVPQPLTESIEPDDEE
ncbi:ArnT family glycosyltransferase [Dokdonella sp.]|uniref:ArnT family glycosyltransferase n=1 Tax=Dokdonella sp. TaxID=2291710 RepID=UPI003529BC58